MLRKTATTFLLEMKRECQKETETVTKTYKEIQNNWGQSQSQ